MCEGVRVYVFGYVSVSACVCVTKCVMRGMEVYMCGCVMNVKDVGVHRCRKVLDVF